MFSSKNTSQPLFGKKKNEKSDSPSPSTQEKVEKPLFRKKPNIEMRTEEKPVKDFSEMNAQEKELVRQEIFDIGRGYDNGIIGKIRKASYERRKRIDQKKKETRDKKEAKEKERQEKKQAKKQKRKKIITGIFSKFTQKKEDEIIHYGTEKKAHTPLEKQQAQATFNELIDTYSFIYHVKRENYFECSLGSQKKN